MSADHPQETPLNMLLVPFPFRIEGSCFRADPHAASGDPTRWRFFSVAQNWLRGIDHRRFADFLLDLASHSRSEVAAVHGIVLPEGVLTLTSLGMIRRSFMPGEFAPAPVALWKEPYGVARELVLPRGSQALLLTLSHSEHEERTLDGRSDGGRTVRLSLSGVRAIELQAEAKRKWYDYGVDGW